MAIISYETDSIFDKFQCCFSGDGSNFASGSYQSLFHVYDRNNKVPSNRQLLVFCTNSRVSVGCLRRSERCRYQKEASIENQQVSRAQSEWQR